jgi:hypothetical protein
MPKLDLSQKIEEIKASQQFIDQNGNICIKIDRIKYEKYDHLLPCNAIVIDHVDGLTGVCQAPSGSLKYYDKTDIVNLWKY